MVFGSTWRGTVDNVSEYDGRPPELALTLWEWRTDHDDPPTAQCLPRAGEKYWLISDYAFQALVKEQETAWGLHQ